MKILNRKAWWNYEKMKYVRKIQEKEESLKLHILEMDKLRNENRRLRKKLNEATVNEANRMIDFVDKIKKHPEVSIPYVSEIVVKWFLNQS